MLAYTPAYASVLALMFVVLSANVIRIRRRERIAVLDGGNENMKRAMRAQGNFAEYIPLSLILLGLFENAGGSALMVHLLGISLVTGRLLHAYSLLHEEPKKKHYANRIRGMVLTLVAIVIMALANLAFALM
jgi:uncharacterized protein